MITRRSSSCRGFTLIEIVVAVSLAVASLGAVVAITTTTSDVADASRTRSRAHMEHLRNLRALVDVLATVDASTLADFQPDDTSTRPVFQRVTDESAGTPVLSSVQYLEWRAEGRVVDDVPAPGSVYLTGAGPDRLVAARVPQGGFQVRRDGRALVVTLTTYYHLPGARRTELVTGVCAVHLRN
jgi:type II secretory pathway pseudopilin PulG